MEDIIIANASVSKIDDRHAHISYVLEDYNYFCEGLHVHWRRGENSEGYPCEDYPDDSEDFCQVDGSYASICPSDGNNNYYNIDVEDLWALDELQAWVVLVSRRPTTVRIVSEPSGIIYAEEMVYRGGTLGYDPNYCSSENHDIPFKYDATQWVPCKGYFSIPGARVSLLHGIGSADLYGSALVSDDPVLTAYFAPTYETIHVDHGNGGTVSITPGPSTCACDEDDGGDGTGGGCPGENGYVRGTEVTISAIPDECYEFDGWEIHTYGANDADIDIHGIYWRQNVETFKITASGFWRTGTDIDPDTGYPDAGPYKTYCSAKFKIKKFTVTCSCHPLSAGEVNLIGLGDASGDVSDSIIRDAECGDHCDAEATPGQCYWLDYWTVNGRILRCWFPGITVKHNTDIVAHFVEKKYKTIGDGLVCDEDGHIIVKCGRPIYGDCTSDESKMPKLENKIEITT